jgi:hypothetical protein
MSKSVRFLRKLPDGSKLTLGIAVFIAGDNAGWRFFPNVSGRRISRKRHATMKKCLPRWLGYPHRCESEVVAP